MRLSQRESATDPPAALKASTDILLIQDLFFIPSVKLGMCCTKLRSNGNVTAIIKHCHDFTA